MMVDKTKESKWDPAYEGPFTAVRKNRGGACILRDRLGETLKRAAPPDQLKMVKREQDEAVAQVPSFEIEKAANHRYDASKKLEHFVVWKNPSLIPGWEPVANFDDVNVTKQCWKTARSQIKRKQKKRD